MNDTYYSSYNFIVKIIKEYLVWYMTNYSMCQLLNWLRCRYCSFMWCAWMISRL